MKYFALIFIITLKSPFHSLNSLLVKLILQIFDLRGFLITIIDSFGRKNLTLLDCNP